MLRRGAPRLLLYAALTREPRPLLHEVDMNTSVLLITAVFCVSTSVLVTADHGSYTKQQVGTPLPMASARPLNMDAGMDCKIKELAWEYAKKLLPQVSHVIPT